MCRLYILRGINLIPVNNNNETSSCDPYLIISLDDKTI